MSTVLRVWRVSVCGCALFGVAISVPGRSSAAPPPANSPAAQPAAAPASADNTSHAGDPSLLDAVQRENAIRVAIIEAQVRHLVRAARQRMADDPDGARSELKQLLEQVARAPELTVDQRARLRGELEAVLREAGRRQAEKDVVDQEQASRAAAAKEQQRTAKAIESRQEKIKQLTERFNSLLGEGRYALAEDASTEIAALDPEAPAGISATLTSRQLRYALRNYELRALEQKGVVAALASAEVAATPQPDEQPVIYPDAQFWQALTLARVKYQAVDLQKQGAAEVKIRRALNEPTHLEFVETPLSDVVAYLKDLHGIEIQLDGQALEEVGISPETPVSRTLRGISLRSALKLMLAPLDLAYVIKNEVLLITTQEKVNTELTTKVYPVADLVLPIKTPQMSGFSGGLGPIGSGPGGMGPGALGQGPGARPGFGQPGGNGPAGGPAGLF